MDLVLQRVRRAQPKASEIRPVEAFFVDGRILVTAVFLSEFYGIQRRTVTNWLAKGLEPVVSKASVVTLYDLQEVVDWHSKNISKDHSARAQGKQYGDPNAPIDKLDPDKVDITTASVEVLERLKSIEDLTKKRLDNQKTRGDLVPAEDLDRAMAEQAVMHRAAYEEDLEILPAILDGKGKTDIARLLDSHYRSRIEDTHEFIAKVFDTPDWLYRKIQELINGEK